jgi:hypothetical protein
MKKIILICLSLIISQLNFGQTEAIDRFVRQSKRGAKEKMDITLPGFLVRFGLNFVDDDDLDGIDVKRIARKISEIRVVTIEKDWGGDKPDFQKFLNEVRAEKFEELITVRDKGERVNVLIREKGNFIRDFLVVVDENDGEMVLVAVNGKFTMDDINGVVQNAQWHDERNTEGDADVDTDKETRKSRKVKTIKTVRD